MSYTFGLSGTTSPGVVCCGSFDVLFEILQPGCFLWTGVFAWKDWIYLSYNIYNIYIYIYSISRYFSKSDYLLSWGLCDLWPLDSRARPARRWSSSLLREEKSQQHLHFKKKTDSPKRPFRCLHIYVKRPFMMMLIFLVWCIFRISNIRHSMNDDFPATTEKITFIILQKHLNLNTDNNKGIMCF